MASASLVRALLFGGAACAAMGAFLFWFAKQVDPKLFTSSVAHVSTGARVFTAMVVLGLAALVAAMVIYFAS